MSCAQCQGIEEQFDLESAEGDLEDYQKKGLSKSSQWLVETLAEKGVAGLSLLDIGGGVGMIQHELLNEGAASATHVDASSAYIEVAKAEAERRGLGDKIRFRHGNFTELAPDIETADIVTLDKVICCFDDMHALVKSSAEKAGKYYGLVFPNDSWWIKMVFIIVNFFGRFRSNPFSIFVHSSDDVEQIVTGSGLSREDYKRGFIWQMIVYAR
jgi:magnesium-protoporphyrin O-methyltransferase